MQSARIKRYKLTIEEVKNWLGIKECNEDAVQKLTEIIQNWKHYGSASKNLNDLKEAVLMSCGKIGSIDYLMDFPDEQDLEAVNQLIESVKRIEKDNPNAYSEILGAKMKKHLKIAATQLEKYHSDDIG